MQPRFSNCTVTWKTAACLKNDNLEKCIVNYRELNSDRRHSFTKQTVESSAGINCVQTVPSVHLRFFEPLNLVACGLLTWISMATEGSITLLCLIAVFSRSRGHSDSRSLHCKPFRSFKKKNTHTFSPLVEYRYTAYTILNA